MKNALALFKEKSGLTFREMAKSAGFSSQGTTYKHCNSEKPIPTDAVIKYSRAFGIPLSELRPDLWNDENYIQAASDKQEA